MGNSWAIWIGGANSGFGHLDSAMSGFRGTLVKHPCDVARVELFA